MRASSRIRGTRQRDRWAGCIIRATRIGAPPMPAQAAGAAMTGRGARPAFRELPEGEGVSLNAGVEKLDLERMVGDAVPGGVRRLAHQLVEPLAGHLPVAVLIDVASVA